MITIEIPETIAELATKHPHAVCTPTLEGRRILPPKAHPVAEKMEWGWLTITRPIILDGAQIRIGDRVGNYGIDGGLHHFMPGEGVILWARLEEITPP